MKKFLAHYKKLHIWLAILLSLLVFFLAGRNSHGLMNFVAKYITNPFKAGMASICNLFPFSVAEVLLTALILFIIVFIIKFIVDLIRKPNKLGIVYSRIMTLVCVGLSVYTGFCILWGINYYTDSFQDLSGIHAQEVSTEELYAVTKYFALQASNGADEIKRDENEIFGENRKDIIGDSTEIYDNLAEEFPYLANRKRVKPIAASKIMSNIDFTGFYFPFTGEANVNMDSPACLLPATVAHEMAHQKGFSSEQECNFIAILASTQSGNPAYEYSGWLFGFIHLNNALYQADEDLWREVYSALPDAVRTDIGDNNDYWKQYEGVSGEVSDAVYDSFLKSYGEQSGIRSYGEVVDLLVEYYKDKTA